MAFEKTITIQLPNGPDDVQISFEKDNTGGVDKAGGLAVNVYVATEDRSVSFDLDTGRFRSGATGAESPPLTATQRTQLRNLLRLLRGYAVTALGGYIER